MQEILAIAIGLSTFAKATAGRVVVLYSDNSGAEKCTAKGAARSFDHNALVHSMWCQALLQRFYLWVKRVPSDANIADAPSRFD